VRRVLLVHDGTRTSSDVFEWMLTMMSSSTSLDVIRAHKLDAMATNGLEAFDKDRQWAEQLGRPVQVLADAPQSGPEIVRQSREGNYDAIILPAHSASWASSGEVADDWMAYVVQHAPCSVFIAIHPTIPREVVG
jgi:nucleotide-binding universal stress UspA family protein